jgi:polygalacturonase
MGATYNATSTDASHLLYAGSCGATIRNCEFREGHDDPAAAGPSIVIRGGYNSLIEGCTFVAGATHQAIQIGDDIIPSRNHKVINCNFHDNNIAAATRYIKVQAGLQAGIVIRDCTFGIATHFIVCGAGTSGIIANCYFADTAATLANSTGKVEIPATQDVKVTGCWGGVSLAVIQSAA